EHTVPTTPRRRTPRPIQPTRARAGTAALALALAVLTGCGSGDGDDRGAGDPAVTATTSSAPTPAAGASDAVPAEISGFRFEPEEIRVAAGGEVRWTNADEVRHTVTADDGTFDLGLDGEGSGGSHRFTEPGTHAYHCSVHPSMTGTVLVD
ncbi:MAG: cupredoxin domain-containing protein, partial [Acidimicrobiales bacterium]|nr:cupredoxin domain-containing protein [Acidimicrobiales bacterium]